MIVIYANIHESSGNRGKVEQFFNYNLISQIKDLSTCSMSSY